MGYKKSNPARTNLIIMVVALALYIFMDFILLLSFISLYVSETKGSIDAAVNSAGGFCGLGFFIPMTLLYSTVALSIALWGRGVYGRKHEVYTFAAFFFGIGGVASVVVLPIFAVMLESVEFMVIVAPIPFICHSVGMYFFIKDIGGKLMGGIGAGVNAFGRFILIVFSLIWVSEGVDSTELALVGIIISLLISIAGYIILLVGFVHSFQWTALNEPLLDEQQVQQMQMQQHQLHLQHETIDMQREQLYLQQETTHLVREQNRALIDAGLIEGIPQKSSAKDDHFHNHLEKNIEEW